MSGGNDSFTKILLHMDGSNGGTTFTDSNFGGAAHTWTAHSATTNTGTVKFATASENCGAAVGWIDTPDSADFTLGAGDFTVDFWCNASGSGTRRFAFGQVDSATTATNLSIDMELTASNVFTFYAAVGSTVTTVTSTTAITTSGWHHVAAVRTGGTLKLFVDGSQEGGNVSIAGTINDSPNNFSVGRAGELTTLTWNGFIDEFRLSVGIARWTANFTPPSAAYYIGIDAAGGSYFETGSPATFSIAQANTTGSYSITGNAAGSNTALNGATGSFSATGNAATFKLAWAPSSGSYAFTGFAAQLSAGLFGGTYLVTGNAATFSISFGPASGAFTVSGNPATLTRDFVNWLPSSGLAAASWTGEAAPSSTWTPATPISPNWTPEFTVPT